MILIDVELNGVNVDTVALLDCLLDALGRLIAK